MIAIGFSLAPLQWLWARVQHLDDLGDGGCLLDLVGSRSPILDVQADLCKHATAASREIPFLATHFASSPSMLRRVLDGFVLAVLAASALVWWRFQHVFEQWPFRLLLMLSSEDLGELAAEFYRAPRCCLDAGMSLKLREAFPYSPLGSLKILALLARGFAWVGERLGATGPGPWPFTDE